MSSPSLFHVLGADDEEAAYRGHLAAVEEEVSLLLGRMAGAYEGPGGEELWVLVVDLDTLMAALRWEDERRPELNRVERYLIETLRLRPTRR